MSADVASLLDSLPAWSFGFILVLARFAAAMAMLPGLGESAAPSIVRVGLALAVTILLLPIVAPLIPPPPDPGLKAAGMVAAELVTGLWFGWLTRVVALALPLTGQFIAYLLGLSTVLQPSPDLGPQASALARLFEIIVPLIILTTGLYALPLAALAGSYRLIPPGALLPAGDSAGAALRTLAEAFALALRLASPFILCGMVWHVATGVVARIVPRIQIYFVAMPGQILGGLALLAALSAAILAAYQSALRGGFATLPGLG